MLIRVASDLHLEQFRGRAIEQIELEYLPKDPRDADSILTLAGDISSDPEQLLNFIKLVESRFKRVVFVPGNHEVYRHDMTVWNKTTQANFTEQLKNTSFALGETKCEEINGVRFIFCTLWADGGADLMEQGQVGYRLNDFRVIKLNDKRFTVQDMMVIHKKMRQDIEQYLAVHSELKTVVVTHHLPSYRLCHPRFGNEINGGFASNCDNMIAKTESAPAVWIFGHSHDTQDLMLWKTRMVSNPAGYWGETNRSEFNQYQAKFIEL